MLLICYNQVSQVHSIILYIIIIIIIYIARIPLRSMSHYHQSYMLLQTETNI